MHSFNEPRDASAKSHKVKTESDNFKLKPCAVGPSDAMLFLFFQIKN